MTSLSFTAHSYHLALFQSKGLVTRHLEEDRAEVEHLQLSLLEEQQRGRQQEAALEQRDRELAQFKEVSRPRGPGVCQYCIIEMPFFLLF